MRLGVLIAIGLLSATSLCLADDVRADIKEDTNIPAEDLGPALEALAKQRHFQVVYVSEQVDALHTQGAKGILTPVQALDQLLIGTGLTYQLLDEKTVTIVQRHASAAGGASRTDSSTSRTDKKEGKTASSTRFRLARMARGQIQEPASVSASKRTSPAASPTLEEVVVTAEKRAETLADVPVPVTAISGPTLAEEHELRLQDYYSSVPGLSLAASNRGDESILAIRGITTGGGNPTIGVVVDGVPYGSSSAYAGGGPPPDLDPSDLARIEVLRGPQGTLYGADSLGGLIKFVTVEPSTRELSGQVRVGADGVHNGTKAGYDVHAAVNVPLDEHLAVRASGFDRRDPGYADNIAYNIHGINQFDVDGGLLSVLWAPTSRLSLNVGALLQDGKTDGSSNIESGLGDLEQNDLLGSGISQQHVHVYHATVDAQFGGVKLTSITGYSDNSVFHIVDFTPVFGPLTQEVFGVTGTPLLEQIRTERATQEMRLTGSLTSSFDWLLGAYYDHEASKTEHHSSESLAGAAE